MKTGHTKWSTYYVLGLLGLVIKKNCIAMLWIMPPSALLLHKTLSVSEWAIWLFLTCTVLLRCNVTLACNGLTSKLTYTCKQVHPYPWASSCIPASLSSPPASKFICTHEYICSYSWKHSPKLTSVISKVTNKRFLWCVIVDSFRNSFCNTLV